MTTLVARHYAQALFEDAREAGTVERIDGEVHMVADTLFTEPSSREFLHSRLIGRRAKKELVTAAFAGKVDRMLLNAILLMVDHDRIGLYRDFEAEFHHLAHFDRGLREAAVASAAALQEAGRRAMTEALEKRFDKKVLLEEKTDPTLIGGIRVLSEGVEYDNSVAGKLEAFRKALGTGKINAN